MSEPKWPSVEDVETGHVADDFCTFSARRAIEMCRAAWLAANDDPSKSPVGEVRRDPNRAAAWIAIHLGPDAAGRTSLPWLVITPSGYTDGVSNDAVKGWPVVGAVPGTPAAEAQR